MKCTSQGIFQHEISQHATGEDRHAVIACLKPSLNHRTGQSMRERNEVKEGPDIGFLFSIDCDFESCNSHVSSIHEKRLGIRPDVDCFYFCALVASGHRSIDYFSCPHRHPSLHFLGSESGQKQDIGYHKKISKAPGHFSPLVVPESNQPVKAELCCIKSCASLL